MKIAPPGALQFHLIRDPLGRSRDEVMWVCPPQSLPALHESYVSHNRPPGCR